MTKERELLRRAYNYIGETYGYSHSIALDIRTFLTTEPEAEPVAWMFQHEDTGLIDFVDTQQVEWGFEKNNPRWQKISPIFLHQPRPEPARKPMKSEEMEKQYEIDKEYFGESVIRAFYNGIRFAEKHHGISE